MGAAWLVMTECDHGLTSNSFLRQRHSYSRLHVAREVFEALMSEFDILPRFKEFVSLFGLRHDENEIGPPQMRFRRRMTSDCPSAGLMRRRYVGFGNGSIHAVMIYG